MPYKFESTGYRRVRSGREMQVQHRLPERFLSVDALRGFDMFWIVGAGYLVSALNRWTGNPLVAKLKEQLTHVEWEGFHFYDLIFPLFVFIVGVSAAFSLRKTIAKHGRGAAAKRVLWRGLLLYLAGVFYSGGFDGPAYSTPTGTAATAGDFLAHLWDNTRLLGVLNRIAFAYTATGLMFVFLPFKLLFGAFAALLLGYWGIMERFEIRDIRLEKSALEELAKTAGETNVVKLYQATVNTINGQYEPGYNVANHFDFNYLPGKKHDTYYDPEGLLSTFPAVASCLLGLFAGLALLREDLPPTGKTVLLLTAGFLFMGLGYLWGLSFPVVKKLWTSSFVLVAGGFSLMLLGLFHQVVDVWERNLWCRPFIWIGSNALTIYFASQILGFRKVAERFVGGPIRGHLGGFGEVLVATVAILLMLGFARALFVRKIFLRL
jgi:predicted acyltransferase